MSSQRQPAPIDVVVRRMGDQIGLEPLNRLIAALTMLPGVGPRSAERMAFHLLRASVDDARTLASAIIELKERVRPCQICYNLSASDRCHICQDERRDRKTICVVEEPKDVLAIEKTGQYRGLYHVLWGSIAPLDGVGPEALKIAELVARVEHGVAEVILATDTDQDGEATALYITTQLKALPVTVTRIASGVPVGSHIEYADQATLTRALAGRQRVEVS